VKLSEKAKRLLEMKARLLEASLLCQTELERRTNSDLLFLVGCSLREELGSQITKLRSEIAKRRNKPRQDKFQRRIKRLGTEKE
jgi:hypothetical protein